MARSGGKIAVAGIFALALAGCGTTTPVPQIPPGITGGVAIGAAAPVAPAGVAPLAPAQIAPVQSAPLGSSVGGMASAPVAGTPTAGLWELRGELGKTCQLNLTATLIGTSYQASPAGLCAPGFDRVAMWSEGNGQLFLFDAQGQLRGRLFPDGAGGFTGNYDDGVSTSELVTFRRL